MKNPKTERIRMKRIATYLARKLETTNYFSNVEVSQLKMEDLRSTIDFLKSRPQYQIDSRSAYMMQLLNNRFVANLHFSAI